MNKEPKPFDLNATANFITRQVKKNIEDKKTWVFIALVAACIYMIGVLNTERQHTNALIEMQTSTYIKEIERLNNEIVLHRTRIEILEQKVSK